MAVTCGDSKGKMWKEMSTCTIAVKTMTSTSLLPVGMRSASDIDSNVGADVMLRGGGGIMGLFHCSFWIHPVSDEGQWRCLWDAVYDNSAKPVNQCGLPSLQDHMVPVPHWTRLITIILCNILKLCMHTYDS